MPNMLMPKSLADAHY